jgi:DNA-directed RNA polymerase specialized sigma24 family protein
LLVAAVRLLFRAGLARTGLDVRLRAAGLLHIAEEEEELLARDASRIAVLAAEAHLSQSDSAQVQFFLERGLGVECTSDTCEALWRELRTNRCRREDVKEPLAYLRTAVWRDAKRIARDREQADRCRSRTTDVVDLDCAAEQPEIAPGPPVLVERKEWAAQRYRIIADVYPTAPEDQRRFLDLVVDQGCTPAEAKEVIGKGWSPYQALQRKVRRRLAAAS